MEAVVLKGEKQPNFYLKPDWYTGSENDAGDGIHHATNKLKSYKVKTKWKANLRTSELTFDPK